MTISKRAARISAVLGACLVSACATSAYQSELYLSSSTALECPGNTVLTCKNPDQAAARECSCEDRSLFWAQ